MPRAQNERETWKIEAYMIIAIKTGIAGSCSSYYYSSAVLRYHDKDYLYKKEFELTVSEG